MQAVFLSLNISGQFVDVMVSWLIGDGEHSRVLLQGVLSKPCSSASYICEKNVSEKGERETVDELYMCECEREKEPM